jgi:hypothetical protein
MHGPRALVAALSLAAATVVSVGALDPLGHRGPHRALQRVDTAELDLCMAPIGNNEPAFAMVTGLTNGEDYRVSPCVPFPPPTPLPSPPLPSPPALLPSPHHFHTPPPSSPAPFLRRASSSSAPTGAGGGTRPAA